MNEKEAVRRSVAEGQTLAQQVVPWPQRGDTPINEFITEGYISCAFPNMISTGAGGFLAPQERVVTVGNYFNTEMRWSALQTGIKQHPSDARLSLDELGDMVGSGGDQFSKRVPAVCVRLGSSGSNRGVDSSLWLTPWEYQLSSSGTVLLMASGPSWLASSVLTTQTAVPAVALQ